jgi:hypothetical protein
MHFNRNRNNFIPKPAVWLAVLFGLDGPEALLAVLFAAFFIYLMG